MTFDQEINEHGEVLRMSKRNEIKERAGKGFIVNSECEGIPTSELLMWTNIVDEELRKLLKEKGLL